MNMQQIVFRLTLDENGVEEIRDFTSVDDAHAELDKATKRGGFYSGTIDRLTFNPQGDADRVRTIRRVCVE